MIAEYDRATLVTTVAICVWAALGVIAPQSIDDAMFHTTSAVMQTLGLAAAVIWARTRLDRESVALAADL